MLERTGDDILTGAGHILQPQGQYRVMLKHQHALDRLRKVQKSFIGGQKVMLCVSLT